MKMLGRGAITTATVLYTVPAGFKTEVLSIDLANTTAATVNCTIYLVPSGGSAGTTNMLVPNSPIGGYSMMQWTGDQVINAGDTIVGTGTGITAHVTGEESRA